MTDKTPKSCAVCGQGHYHRIARPGRIESYKDFDIKIPDDMALLECDFCHEILMSPEDMEKLSYQDSIKCKDS